MFLDHLARGSAPRILLKSFVILVMLQSLYDYKEFLEDEDSEPLWLIILVRMPRASWAGLCQGNFKVYMTTRCAASRFKFVILEMF